MVIKCLPYRPGTPKAVYQTLSYVLGKQGSTILGPVQGTARELTPEFVASFQSNPRIQNPLFHFILSTENSKKNLNESQWEVASRAMLAGLGYGSNQAVLVKHEDTDHPHVHIIVSRIRPDGKVTVNSFERRKAHKIAAELERQFGLRQLAHGKGQGSSYPTYKKHKIRIELRKRLKRATRDRPRLDEFLRRCENEKIGVLPNIGGSHVSGIRFEYQGIQYKGSALGYSWATLCKKLQVDLNRDLPVLQALAGQKASGTDSKTRKSRTIHRSRTTLLSGLGRVAKGIEHPFTNRETRGEDEEGRSKGTRRKGKGR